LTTSNFERNVSQCPRTTVLGEREIVYHYCTAQRYKVDNAPTAYCCGCIWQFGHYHNTP
jgi:hypothetical protein